MDLQTKRLAEVDLLRAVALVAVAVIHASAWVTPADAPLSQGAAAATIGLARFCVPAFVFASGFVLYLSRTASSRRQPVGYFLRRRVSRILIPWACWVPVFLALDWQHGAIGPVGSWLAFGPGHLYFLLLVAQLSAAFLLVPSDRVRLRWAAAGAVALQLALALWRTHGPLPGGALAWPAVYLVHEEAPFWLGTFLLGCVAAAEWPRLARLARLWPLGLLAAVAAGALVVLEAHFVPGGSWRQGNAAYVWPSRLVQTVVWSLALLWVGRWFRRLANSRIVSQLSLHSLGIYILHPIALDMLGPRTAALPGALRVAVLVACCLAAAWLAVRLLAMTGLGAFALGEPLPNREPRIPPADALPAAA